MKKALMMSLVGVVALSGAAQAQNVLVYEDSTLGVSAYQEAVECLGWDYTLVTDGTTFAAELSGANVYTHVVSAHQNTSGAAGFEDALVTWANSHPGAPVLISDWRINTPQAYLPALGFGYGVDTNLLNCNGISGDTLGCIASPVVSPGWGIYCVEVLGGTTVADDGLGNAIVAQNGSWFFNGFLSDTLDADVGRELVIRQLATVITRKCPSDIDGNGDIGFTDLLNVLSNWGPCVAGAPAAPTGPLRPTTSDQPADPPAPVAAENAPQD